jgi:hypothetical protein
MDTAEKLRLLARLELLAGDDQHLLDLIAAVRADLVRRQSRDASWYRTVPFGDPHGTWLQVSAPVGRPGFADRPGGGNYVFKSG